MKNMIPISAKLLVSIVTVLAAVATFLAASNVHVAVNPLDPAFGAVGNLISPLQIFGAHDIGQVIVDHERFATGTSTVCSFKTPNATTTGTVVAAALTVPFAQTFQIANGLTNNATTTDLGSFTSAALAATVTTIYPPNSFINVKAGTSSGTTVNANFAPTGLCDINLTVL